MKVSCQGNYPTLVALELTSIPASVAFRYGAIKIAMELGVDSPIIRQELQNIEQDLKLPLTDPPDQELSDPGPRPAHRGPSAQPDEGLSGDGFPSSQDAG